MEGNKRNAAGSQSPTDSQIGAAVKPDVRYEYKLEGKGLFVIIKQMSHKLRYPHYNDNYAETEESPSLDYDTDTDRLLKVFNLKADRNRQPDEKISGNLKLGENLTHTPANGSLPNSFDAFMDDVKAYDKKPSFVMFFLMSHGFNDGVFLLSTNPEQREVAEPCCEGREKHTHTGECHTRKLVDDVIEPVAKTFPDIPKILIIQTCRGSLRKVGDGARKHGAGDPVSQNNDDLHAGQLFLPRYSHTLVYQACIEGSASYVDKGSWLIRNFCDVLEELYPPKALDSLDTPMEQHKTFISRLYNKVIKSKGLGDVTSPELQLKRLNEEFKCDLRTENMIGGWMTDVLDRTTGRVSCDLLQITYPEYYSDGSSLVCPHEKQQPHINSTLPYSLSYIKIHDTQWKSE